MSEKMPSYVSAKMARFLRYMSRGDDGVVPKSYVPSMFKAIGYRWAKRNDDGEVELTPSGRVRAKHLAAKADTTGQKVKE